MIKVTLSTVTILALICAAFGTSAVAGDNYTVSTGNQSSTYKSQSQAPAPAPKPAPKPPVETKTIMAPTWPVQVPVRVPKNTPERPDNPHAGENVGAAQGLGSGK